MEFRFRYFALCYLFSVIDGFKWFSMKSLYKNIQLMLELLKAAFLVLHFFHCTLMTFLMMLSTILLSMLMVILSTLSVIGIWSVATNRAGCWTWIWSTRFYGLGQEVTCGFQWWKNSTCFFLMILVLLMSGSVLKEKTSIKILGMTFLLNWIGALTLSHLLLAATWKCLVSYKNGYIGLLVHHLLPVLNSRLMIEIKPA